MHARFRFPLALACAQLLSATSALAAWTHDPSLNLPVCTVGGNQLNVTIAPDGQGGAFVAWEDYRTPANGADVYAQHVLKSGALDPAWPANGLAVVAIAGAQTVPVATSDGAGGVIIAWQDHRGTSNDIYAQRISAAGTIVAPWPANGKALSTLTNEDTQPSIVGDGAGGAWVVWTRYFGGSDYDPILTHVFANSSLVFASGYDLDNAPSTESNPSIAVDDSGGCFVAYQTNAGGAYDIRVTRMKADGTNPWNYYFCQAANDQTIPVIADDGRGSATVAWVDARAGTGDTDVYGIRVLGSGIRAPGYFSDGSNFASGGGGVDASPLAIVPDGAGGEYVIYQTCFFGCTESVIRVGPNGVYAPGWTNPGTVLNGGALNTAIPDGLGGMIVAGASIISLTAEYPAAAHITPAGNSGPGWALPSLVSNTGAPMSLPVITTDGAGGAILAWAELRNNSDYDVFAQRIEHFGQLGNPEPSIVSVKDVPNDQGGEVNLKWNASYLDAPPDFRIVDYRIWRQSPAATAQLALAHGATLLREDGARPGAPPAQAQTARETSPATRTDPLRAVRGPVFRADVQAGQTYYWELISTQLASQQAAYSITTPTNSDSVGAGNPRTLYYVDAFSGYQIHWDSAPDSGYSVDNLPPIAPAPFTANFVPPNGTFLAWGANSESDLAGYRLYRGGGLNFTPTPANRIYQGTEPSYHDATAIAYIYKVCAYDVHGNEGGCTTAQPPGTTDAPSEIPKVLMLSPVEPNPARDGANLRFGLPQGGRVVVSIYDAQGRRVRTVVDAWLPAGYGETRWDGRDAAGESVGSGMYFARIELAGKQISRRFVRLE